MMTEIKVLLMWSSVPIYVLLLSSVVEMEDKAAC